ncbi:MAG: 3-isopropylmalate dehydratase large subunit [Steroidobacteraceae bacterium]
MNLIESILARASGRQQVQPGDIVVAEVDRMIMHDLSGYITSRLYEEKVAKPLKHADRVIMVFDHIFSPPREREAEVLKSNCEWAAKYGVKLLNCGSGNIHNAVVREGFIGPGMVVVGSDSHTPVHGALGAFAVAVGNDCHAGMVFPYGKAWFRVPATIRIELTGSLPDASTPRDVALWLVGKIGEGGAIYKALEFGGPFVEQLGLFDRWLLPLITVDVGAKCGYIEPDEKVFEFARTLGTMDRWQGLEIAPRTRRTPEAVWEFNVSAIEPQVACPPTVGNVKAVRRVAGTPIQWAEIGGHGGGRIEDIRLLARVLAGKTVHPSVRLNVVPASRAVFAEALEEGLVRQLHDTGALWFPPSTGSNQSVNMGAMAAGESMISTHSRNFPGRNGSAAANMYLGSALTVGASALRGCITDARDLL